MGMFGIENGINLGLSAVTSLGSAADHDTPVVVTPPILEILAKYGINAHLWMPGVGTIDGVDSQNFIDIAGTQASVVGQPVGRIADSGGGSVAAAASVDVTRPTLEQDANGNFYIQCGSWQFLTLGSPVFQMTDDWCVVAGASLTASGEPCGIFSQSNLSNHALPELFFTSNGQLDLYIMGFGGLVNIPAGPNNAGLGPLVVSALSKSLQAVLRRNGIQISTGTLSGNYAEATKAALGAFFTVNATQFLNGSLYPVVAIKGTVSDDDLSAIEQWVAYKSGVNL